MVGFPLYVFRLLLFFFLVYTLTTSLNVVRLELEEFCSHIIDGSSKKIFALFCRFALRLLSAVSIVNVVFVFSGSFSSLYLYCRFEYYFLPTVGVTSGTPISVVIFSEVVVSGY